MTNEQIYTIFSSSEERLVAILGNNIAQKFFATGAIEEGFAILSNKRLYFKGTCLLRHGRGFSKIHEERTVDVVNVTGTGFVHTDPLWLQLLAIVCWILGGIATIAGIQPFLSWGDPSILLIGFGLGLVGLILWLVYKAKKRTIFEVAFAGGGIGMDASWIDASEAEFFQKNIKLVGDNLRNQERMYGKATSGAAELERYASLLEKGLVTREEFEAQKRKLLG